MKAWLREHGHTLFGFIVLSSLIAALVSLLALAAKESTKDDNKYYRLTVWSAGRAVQTFEAKGRPDFGGGYATWHDAATGERMDATGTITYAPLHQNQQDQP